MHRLVLCYSPFFHHHLPATKCYKVQRYPHACLGKPNKNKTMMPSVAMMQCPCPAKPTLYLAYRTVSYHHASPSSVRTESYHCEKSWFPIPPKKGHAMPMPCKAARCRSMYAEVIKKSRKQKPKQETQEEKTTASPLRDNVQESYMRTDEANDWREYIHTGERQRQVWDKADDGTRSAERKMNSESQPPTVL
ncbi:hypothetical protein HDK90DRAFT_134430 [Phyllosticta capitalensis]|uniref:Uncharacterized protein n=1 Tax=Phyllosticta capitalensis TaxID=121624 RepID=A0ABR1YYL7_9PEZI